MNETRVRWWMDADSRWNRGLPPAGWWQAEDGRWHAPGDEPTVEMQEGPPPGAAHLARPVNPAGGWGWPRWARIAVLASVATLAVAVVGVAAMTDRGGENDQVTVTAETTTTVGPDTTAAPSTGSDAPDTTSSGPTTSSGEVARPSAPPTTVRPRATTTAPPETSTVPPPSNAGVRQGAPCSPEGATAVSQDGVPMTCTTQKCHGTPFDDTRWRRTAC